MIDLLFKIKVKAISQLHRDQDREIIQSVIQESLHAAWKKLGAERYLVFQMSLSKKKIKNNNKWETDIVCWWKIVTDCFRGQENNSYHILNISW